jgi:predicted metal-dependent phosphoesterase TrpH
VQLWALTDHDELAGQAEAAAEARRLGMVYIPGVEVSVTFAGETVHILGLDVDPTHPALVQGLHAARRPRRPRPRHGRKPGPRRHSRRV